MKTILILDDEHAVRQSFSDYFEDHLWSPIQAESAEDALVMLKDEQPDAAIVDVRLPGMDGTEFIREISKLHLTIASVICTGSPEFEMPDDLRSLNFVSDSVFKKPVSDLSQLEQELSRILASISKEGRSE